MVELLPTTFTDDHNSTLKYSLKMPNPQQELPSWISLRGLVLMGTPPEKYSPLSYEFLLVAENEFRSETVPFTLKIHI